MPTGAPAEADSTPSARVLIVGWFSFEQMGATAGDLMAADVVQSWLSDAGIDFDVAVAPPFTLGINLDEAAPANYSHLVFVCGPFGNGPPITDLLDRFAGIPLIGVDLSLLESLATWNPFHRVFPRDVDDQASPDLSFSASAECVPVVGLILADKQNEYRSRAKHDRIHDVIREFLDGVEGAIVPIDTRLDENRTGLRTDREIISLIARTDIVVTTRLHGLVLSLKMGVPAVAVDAIEGGAKVSAQAKTLGWPFCLTTEDCSPSELAKSFASCLKPEARDLARACRESAVNRILDVRREFLESLIT